MPDILRNSLFPKSHKYYAMNDAVIFTPTDIGGKV